MRKHTSELVERHDIVVRYGLGYPALDVNAAVSLARELADAWATAHAIDIGTPSALSRHGEAGVTFEVHVGHGDIDADQRVPGVLDNWRWSARMLWWRKVMTNADGRQGRLLARREEAGRADVIPLGRNARHNTGKVQAAMGVGVDGCVCHLGGPFVDMCPIHYDGPTSQVVRQEASRCSQCYQVAGHRSGCPNNDQVT